MFEFDHLRKNNFTYFQHLRRASSAGLLMITSGVMGVVHSALPFIFTDTMTNTANKIIELHKK